jgi:GTPase SAR1 family protein
MSQTASVSSKPLTPQGLRSRIKRVREDLGAFVSKRGNDRLKTLWPEWQRRLDEIHERSQKQPEVAISLVGGTGAGKSTLLNALIGVRVLPVRNMQACTAATCEVSYADGPYRARVEFISRESWEREVQLLLGDLRDTQGVLDDDSAADPSIPISRAVREKLWTVYRPSEEGDLASFDPFRLVEPPDIKAYLDSGNTEIESADVDDFRKQVKRFLDSQHRFWPIVRTVAIRGPFALLRDGAKIIDLPGINDPNETREAVTKSHLKTCRFVWLVFNIKRALTKDAIQLMQSDDFLRQVVMDGRADSLTFVGTAADDVDHETGIEEFQLDDDATIIDVVAARNKGVRDVIREQLDDLSLRLAQLAHEQRDTAVRLAARLKASKIFTVSAREYLRLEGLARTNSAGFADVDQTEVPALVAHLRKISHGYGVTAHCQALDRQLNLIAAEIQGELQSQQAILYNRAEISERGRKEMRAAVEAARTFLDHDLDDARERLAQDLEASQSVLAERVKRAVERARHDLDQTLDRWQRMHHNTIKAVCRRGGAYVGTHRNDFPADLAKPILDGIAFAWSEFFGERLRQTLEKWTERLLRHAAGYRDRLGKSLAAAPDLSAGLITSIDAIFETTAKVLQELLVQTNNATEGKIQHEQRTLYEAVPEQVKANMKLAFLKAGDEKGAGMKTRMVAILAEHARKISQVMFDDARDALINGVRNLNDWLVREYDKMIEAVKRNAALAAENLVAGGERMTAAAVEVEQGMLNDLATLLRDPEFA